MSHNTLERYYKLLFSLAQHHKYSFFDLENLIPFELDIYTKLLVEYLESKKLEEDQKYGI